MTSRACICVLSCTALAWSALGCRRGADDPPPPDARRPTIKSQAELAAEREERIQSGQVVPADAAPRLATEASAEPPRRRLPNPIRPSPGAIQADILLVNDSVLTLPEILYPLHERIAESRRTQTPQGFVETLKRLLQVYTQQSIGALLIYQQAMAHLSDPQHAAVDDAVDREVKNRISRGFGDSSARLENHLARHGLTLEQYRALLERDLVAQQYVRERLLPKVTVRRDEIVAHYRQNLDRYSSEETRELCMIEAPFEAFLPPGTTWTHSPDDVRAQARLRASRHIQAAHQALADRPFVDVAREYSKGVHASQGGVWGEIGRPLQPPYDDVTRLIFEFSEGQTSQPLETEDGWCIVRCGKITAAKCVPFTAVQEEIRQALVEHKFAELSSDYMVEIAERATVYQLDSFLNAAVQRVLSEQAEPLPEQARQ